MAKKVFYDDDARRRVLGGARILYEAVKTTMGPKGRNVVYMQYGKPTVTHDGVSVAKAVDIADVDDETLGYKVGAELIKQAASKMNDVAGDGTTTVTVLTYHILNEANKLIAAGHNPMQLRKGLEAAAADVIAHLDTLAETVEGNKKRITEVATISAGDKEIGALIADVMEKVGKDGVVTVEEGQGLHLESAVVEGFTFSKGFVSPYLVTDTTRMEAVYSKPAIIVTDKKIASIQEILPLLEKLAEKGEKNLVLIAEDVEGEALGALILNKLKGVFNAVAVKAPEFGERRKDVLNDIAVLTGATVVSEDQGMTFDSVGLEVIGRARKVIVTKDETTIIEGAGAVRDVKARIDELNAQMSTVKSEFDRESLEKRRAALSGKVAVIKVGGASETEIEEKKFRVDDAVHAVKAALDEGVVAGGGVTLIELGRKLIADRVKSTQNGTPKLLMSDNSSITGEPGADVLLRAMIQPFLVLMENAGLNAQALFGEILANSGKAVDVNTGQLVQPLKVGIIDPKRVTREALQSAVSIAGTGMTMGALVVDVPDAKAGGGAPDMSGLGM